MHYSSHEGGQLLLVPLSQQLSNGVRAQMEKNSGLQEEQAEETRNEELLSCVLDPGVWHQDNVHITSLTTLISTPAVIIKHSTS